MTSTSMPDEPYYTSEQIRIPPEFPDVLLQFSKAAIRTQPTDVLMWSAAYVGRMSIDLRSCSICSHF